MDVEAVPHPRSPPRMPDLCGRHCLQAQLLLLTREIAFLEEEIQSIEGIQPASVCCKEVEEYVGMIPEPLIPIYKKRKKKSRFWRRLCTMVVCFNMPTCCSGAPFSWFSRHWHDCRPTWTHRSTHCRCPCSACSCSRLKCVPPSLSCPGYSCGCVCSCSKCSKVCICPRCLSCISYCICE
ncbi:guanine nucleotide-binding protein subunit gamma 3-like [Zingiber officinale]|uniref:guanine nucleotide-binding protein subunit gamma 3-like n=1 Tax=Zingiber officinale TaxID=94328 RepID=UPI001C4B7DE3|nr:guanine nucleotide-binding protein subunit gamma 3-like [Zingiber officinale]